MTRVRISNSSLNCYGTRVMTAGLDISQFERNPVLLFMHRRGEVIGYVKDVKKEGDDVTGELVFDEASEESRLRKKQFEFGSIRMVSASIDIIEWSDDPVLMLEGQERPSISRSRLTEVSLVDIGGNDDAIRLTHEGVELKLSNGMECRALPLLTNINTNINNRIMDLKAIALSLGLSETATEEQINAKAAALKADAEQNAALKAANEQLSLGAITTIVEAAIAAKKIKDADKEHFIKLGKVVGQEELKKTFDAMSAAVKITDMLDLSNGKGEGNSEYKKLSDVPADKVMELREKNMSLYKRLYKAEYGFECEISD